MSLELPSWWNETIPKKTCPYCKKVIIPSFRETKHHYTVHRKYHNEICSSRHRSGVVVSHDRM